MSLRWRLMYAIGFVPWDTGRVGTELEALAGELPTGRALDIGCGTGTQAVWLAEQGWQVSAVDVVGRALDKGRAKAQAKGVQVDFHKLDLSQLAGAGLAPGYTLLHDRGCYHALPEDTRAVYAAAVTELAAPGAVFLMMAFLPGSPGPSGADRAELERRFAPGWTVAGEEPDAGPPPKGPVRNRKRIWYRLVRRG